MSQVVDRAVPHGWAAELVHLFQRLRMAEPLSLRQIATRAGYVPSHVRNILNGTGRPSADAVLAVAGALNASAEDRRLAVFCAEQLRRSPAGQRDRAAGPHRAAQPAPPRELPNDLRSFVGRESELGYLDQLVTAGIAAIDGTAGAGKTALAVRFANRVAERFPAGQLYVDLRG